jgi:hypothetical protein
MVTCKSVCIGQEKYTADSVKIDSAFTYYFTMLDAYVTKRNWDYPGERGAIIGNLETITDISADGDGNYFGKFDFSAKNLVDWKNWYAHNRRELVWNEHSKRVENRPLKQVVQYKFGKAVDASIDSLLAKRASGDSTMQFYFFLTRSLGRDNYQLFIESYIGPASERINTLINFSSRYYAYRQIKIPICLDSDLDFVSNYGKTNGVVLRQNLKASPNFIEFARNGKVLSRGR